MEDASIVGSEEIDGISCVNVRSRWTDRHKENVYTIWFAPDRSWLPLRVEIRTFNSSWTDYRNRIVEYGGLVRDEASGRWFATRRLERRLGESGGLSLSRQTAVESLTIGGHEVSLAGVPPVEETDEPPPRHEGTPASGFPSSAVLNETYDRRTLAREGYLPVGNATVEFPKSAPATVTRAAGDISFPFQWARTLEQAETYLSEFPAETRKLAWTAEKQSGTVDGDAPFDHVLLMYDPKGTLTVEFHAAPDVPDAPVGGPRADDAAGRTTDEPQETDDGPAAAAEDPDAGRPLPTAAGPRP